MLIAAEKKGDKSWCGDCDDGKFVSESLYIYIWEQNHVPYEGTFLS